MPDLSTLRRPQKFALIVGALLLVVGVVGFLLEASFAKGAREELIGIWDVNGWNDVIYVVLGLLGLATFRDWRQARLFCLLTGWLFLLIAVWGFYVDLGDEIVSGPAADTPSALIHLVIGAIGLYCGSRSERQILDDEQALAATRREAARAPRSP